VKAFVAATSYDPTDKKANNQELEDFMRAEMESGNFVCDELETTLRMSSNMAEVPAHRQLPNNCVLAYYMGTDELP
jgi:hypothetical protein